MDQIDFDLTLTKAREARTAIEHLYVEMRHLFNSGFYNRLGKPGEVLTDALLTLSPEIYGSMGDQNKVELEGLVYVIDRLPKGIESCRYIKLISEEGYADSNFDVIVPQARRRNCYRIDADHMYIEVTRGRSEIYDILTHLTFLFAEAEKIKNHALDEEGLPRVEWQKLEAIMHGNLQVTEQNKEVAFSYLSSLLGRSFAETKSAYERLNSNSSRNSGLFKVVYGLGKLAMEDDLEGASREITFSPILRERIGHHIYGERWADQIKRHLHDLGLQKRPLHIISANLHSVMNTIYAYPALLQRLGRDMGIVERALVLSKGENGPLRSLVKEYALKHGMTELQDPSGTNISVQIYDSTKFPLEEMSPELKIDANRIRTDKPVILVMDYAFGEQAYETLDELLKPLKDIEGPGKPIPVRSINVMGKAGILEGGKGDIMIPTAHVFEGTADNYPIKNALSCKDFESEVKFVCEGPMITVLGTSLQNRDVLAYFRHASWQAVGLEMEGAHYQKAVQAAMHIRHHISTDVVLRYAYYASDNPLLTGSTLAQGSLGEVGVKPTYLITRKFLEHIFSAKPTKASRNGVSRTSTKAKSEHS